MKKGIMAAAALLLCIAAAGQAHIETKKFKIADFPLKTTKVVLTGNEMLDNALQKAVTERWVISPFEFCAPEEFEEIKIYDSYYFLLLIPGKEHKEGIQFLSVRKGGPPAAQGIDKMLEVVEMPYAAIGTLSIRGLIFLPAMLDIIQDFIPKALENDWKGYAGLNSYGSSLKKMQIYFAEEDLSEEVTDQVREKYFGGSLLAVDEDEADDIFDSGESGVLVSYTVAPEEPQKGSLCYKMLIDAETHDLYYFKISKIKEAGKAGFDAGDIRKITKGRKS